MLGRPGPEDRTAEVRRLVEELREERGGEVDGDEAVRVLVEATIAEPRMGRIPFVAAVVKVLVREDPTTGLLRRYARVLSERGPEFQHLRGIAGGSEGPGAGGRF